MQTTDLFRRPLSLNTMLEGRSGEGCSLGIDYVYLTHLQMAKIFSIGLPANDASALRDEFGYWCMGHMASHAKVLSWHCQNELLPGTRYSSWASRADAPKEMWRDYRSLGVTVDLSGVCDDLVSPNEVATNAGILGTPWPSSYQALDEQMAEIAWIAENMWGSENERAQQTLELLLEAIPEATQSGRLEPSLAPVVLAVRLCTCQFAEIGYDILPASQRNVVPLIPIETGSTLEGFFPEDVPELVMMRRIRERGRMRK